MKQLYKKSPAILLLAMLLFSLPATAQLDLPRGSQKAKVHQRIGNTDVTIMYSRPSVREREIWGKLVPYGMNNLGFGTAKESPWRAGADENTIIKFSDDVTIQGQTLKAGKYGLHMIINEGDAATIIFSKNHGAWGSYFYDPAEDALRVDVSTNEIPHTELLTFVFDEVEASSATAALYWEKKRIPIKVEVDVTNLVLEDIRNQLQSSPGFSRQSWEQAANYAMNNDGDLEEAMGWLNSARDGQFFSQKTFGNTALKMQLLLKMGKKDEALALVDEAAGMANMNQLNNLGYQLLNMGEHEKAVKYFKLNVKNNPTNANVYDSLGEAYKTMGDKKNAIKNLEKSLSMNPPPAVRANSEKLLKELGAGE
ncbi:MAG: DUF2911 domain-containing protein [Eudoraea sp.]|nr:DUF2911 domain-containing protein [Eudoraea sp.]